MGTPDNKSFDIVDIVWSWIPRKSQSPHVSRDFWMPDKSCRVCYECDSQFTVFNRRHHCRLCGRVFCVRCASRSIPSPSDEPRTICEDTERIRVCNYCFKQWEQGMVTVSSNGASASCPGLSPSSSSSCTENSSSSSTAGSTAYSTGPYEHVSHGSCASPQPSSMSPGEHGNGASDEPSVNPVIDVGDTSFCMFRSDDEDNYCAYRSDSEARHFSQSDEYYGTVGFYEMEQMYRSYKTNPDEEVNDSKVTAHLPPGSFITHDLKGIKNSGEGSGGHGNGNDYESSLYGIERTGEDLDFENNGVLWLPPEPEDEEDDREADLFYDEDDEAATGEWGYTCSSSSFKFGDLRHREKSNEEHKKAMRNVVSGHFRALIAQLLQVENLPLCEGYDKESWLDIITSLSWEAAALLKPDMSEGGGMDPGGYVKVKCLACGCRSDSMVVKGVVCKKNVAHRRMTSRIDKPRLLILGGALEYQRVSHHLSSLDTLLQQEMDHLKMAVAKIDAQHPNILLVEKSVSRFAQEYLLAKNISLVLNIKRPLLQRIARCTGAQIVPSIDHLVPPRLGYCDLFHVEKYFEEHGSAGKGGKKLLKTLMFIEGCPKPLGCTILLKGAHGDELKKVKHVIHYGVFAAYHLALETSFLADEGASLPELPLKSPITVALPQKPSSTNKAISTISGFTLPTTRRDQSNPFLCEAQESGSHLVSDLASLNCHVHGQTTKQYHSSFQPQCTDLVSNSSLSIPPCNDQFPDYDSENSSNTFADQILKNNLSAGMSCGFLWNNHAHTGSVGTTETSQQGVCDEHSVGGTWTENNLGSSDQNFNDQKVEFQPLKEEFAPSLADNQSILVSVTTRCVRKGLICERAHFLRIKYYGSFDKPLGRFLQDQLFDQNCRCHSCEMQSEAHIYCYTHRQGSLTISVRKLEFLLPGEREGKIWMWHRCLLCPRANGFPPATRRVIMSDAAWGLSFGKFLELSFSNNVAASRVASCGHSLHRDCLRFYGCGRMVACFRYSSIDVLSVYLPPPKLEFNYDKQEWVQKEAREVSDRAELLFTEACNALNQILEKVPSAGSLDSNVKASQLRKHITELESMLKKEKEEFEGLLHRALNRDAKVGQYAIDILEINRLRRHLLLHSYVWDQRLIYAAKLHNNISQEERDNIILKYMEKPLNSVGKIEMNATSKLDKGYRNCDTNFLDGNPGINPSHGGNISHVNEPGAFHKEISLDQEMNYMKKGEEVTEHDPFESRNEVQRVLPGGQSSDLGKLSSTPDAAWTGESHPGDVTPNENGPRFPIYTVTAPDFVKLVTESSNSEKCANFQCKVDIPYSPGNGLPTKSPNNIENSTSWMGYPFVNLYRSFNKNSSWNMQKLDSLGEYNPLYIMSFCELERLGGARLLLPLGINDTVVPVYDDEPTSIISYALISPDYPTQMSNDREVIKDGQESSNSLSLLVSANLLSLHSSGEAAFESTRSLGSFDESILSLSSSRNSMVSDPLFYTKALHKKVSFADDGPPGKVKYTVTCYYAKQFEALRKICCPSELDFIRSLSRCKKWGAQGGKSNVFFAKTLDDRFIIKQVMKTELESFIKFASAYFKYLSESIISKSPTCLAKILGLYQVASKHLKGGKESKMDVLVMENLLFRRNVTRLYDLKGSCRSRYNPDSSGGNKVLLDQNLIETMPTSPIFVGNKAKRLLERAVWNDTSFLASIDVMDYSLLVGMDEEKHELVLGIIDFMRQYTWDKHLETWVKASGILGGPKNESPTVISPKQYKRRFRKAMSAYFLLMPDQWSPPRIIPSGSMSDLCEDGSQDTLSPLD
ncbi:hypothetical protein Nepgr_005969 [Nepenthes gracilis]|uniref:1-phosphatidylinositol-3-phosphate 5-kinase n=1 Tax=Nepenthes gracilis TaxID=150966 RepID=A0AAD3S4J4_NEPGR|nr:hypothetical protein Nepgr_005969 [Nepenthes gracilis]